MKVWVCMQCGYALMGNIKKMAKRNYGCPRCHTNFENFVEENWPEPKEANEECKGFLDNKTRRFIDR